MQENLDAFMMGAQRSSSMTQQHSVLIIGASRGLGLAYYRVASARGSRAIGASRTHPDGCLDVTDSGSIRAYARKHEEDMRSVDTIVYTPGVHMRGPVKQFDSVQASDMFAVNMCGWLQVVRAIHAVRTQGEKPYQLITICSTAAWKAPMDEALYSASHAARARLASCFHGELAQDLPGSTSLIVYPGGMQTSFWSSEIDTRLFLNTHHVARIVWRHAREQRLGRFPEKLHLHIGRTTTGPAVSYENKIPL